MKLPSPIKVFIDSDVIISSLISENGAAYNLINEIKLPLIISNYSLIELEGVVKRLNLEITHFNQLVKNKLKVIRINKTIPAVKKLYASYVIDSNDTHIIAGSVLGKTNFLITYNIKHYRIDRIKADFQIIVTTPARFLQYLRSLE